MMLLFMIMVQQIETINISKKFPNVNLIQGDFKGFGWTKNHAASFAANDWILIIDSDEIVDAELLAELKNKKLDKKTVYKLNFKAFYKDIQVKTLWGGIIKRLKDCTTKILQNITQMMFMRIL